MLRQIRILTKLELCNLYGLNVLRFSKDKKSKQKTVGLLMAWAILLAMLIGYVGGLSYGLIYLGLEEAVPAYLITISSLLIAQSGECYLPEGRVRYSMCISAGNGCSSNQPPDQNIRGIFSDDAGSAAAQYFGIYMEHPPGCRILSGGASWDMGHSAYPYGGIHFNGHVDCRGIFSYAPQKPDSGSFIDFSSIGNHVRFVTVIGNGWKYRSGNAEKLVCINYDTVKKNISAGGMAGYGHNPRGRFGGSAVYLFVLGSIWSGCGRRCLFLRED